MGWVHTIANVLFDNELARAGHIARFNNDDHGKAAASKYVDFLNAE